MKKTYSLVVFCFLVIISVTVFLKVVSFRGVQKEVFYRGNRFLVSIDGKNSSTMPSSGQYYLADYDCSNKNTFIEWDKESYQLKISNGRYEGGVACNLQFESFPHLADMSVGSFVRYVGNYGCVGDSCLGANANRNESFLGYCGSSDSQFSYDGFRIAYSIDGYAYLISAGAVECVNGKANSINDVALRYCNLNFTEQCDVTTVHAMGELDFNRILKRNEDFSSCLGKQLKSCGYFNDLIDIGSYYYLQNEESSNGLNYWDSTVRGVLNDDFLNDYGLRPVIRMDQTVLVIGGSGSYDAPYQITNRTFFIDSIQDETLKLRMSGYQVQEMCINLNSSVCTNYIPYHEEYSLDISKAISGENVVYVYYKDSSGEIVSILNKKFNF